MLYVDRNSIRQQNDDFWRKRTFNSKTENDRVWSGGAIAEGVKGR